ncbi:hypothetical protein [Pedobacter agri]|uniref:hypothetical protein n=1 Tax=Pedobacter agri TaxID=454586 RepID=UPI00292F3C26|nr:hypothetical protein [Pedobacter agri]
MRIAIKFFKTAKFPLAKTAKVLIAIIAFASCKSIEPAFNIKGDRELLKDVKINVEMLKDDTSTIETTFFKGKIINIDNQNTLRYALYVSYKDSVFYKLSFDNLHHEVKGEPINEIIVNKQGEALMVWYKPLEKGSIPAGNILMPWSIFIAGLADKAIAKDKFINFYRTR